MLCGSQAASCRRFTSSHAGTTVDECRVGGQAVSREPSSSPPLTAPRDPMQPGGPTVLRIVLGTQLRRLREDRGITREAAGEAIRASHAKISRLELGRVGIKERDIEDLLTLYGVTDPAERQG